MANKRRIAKIDNSDVPDDGLLCSEVGRWAEEKHGLVSMYSKLFSTGMKHKWDERVYIELYAGSGYSKIRGTSRMIPGSPIRALTLEDTFDKYIFCEKKAENLEALRIRVGKTSPSAKVAFVLGDCNEHVEEILTEIPAHSPNHRVLSLCFVDPYDIGIKFGTLRRLSGRYVDFLVLLALYMDANRNIDNYVSEDSVKIDEFLGSRGWREKWKNRKPEGSSFPQFLSAEFSANMETLGYKHQPFYKMKPITLTGQNDRLYRLALFSRNALAYKFWDQVLKYSTDQTKFSWD